MSGAMAGVTAGRRAVRGAEQKKKLTEDVRRKTVILKSKMPGKPTEIRSPLMERSNRAPQKKTATVKSMDHKMVKPISKENVRPVVNKDGKAMTFSQSFLKTKTLKDGTQKEESAKAEQKPAVKPVLGAYRGKIVQSKINSFRKPADSVDNKSAAPKPKTTAQSATAKPNVPNTRKPMVRPSSVSDAKSKKMDVPPKKPPVTSQVKSSTSVTIKSKAQNGVTRRTTHVITTATTQTKPSTTSTKRKMDHVTLRRTTHVLTTHNKPQGANIQQGPEGQKTEPTKGSDLPGMPSKKRATIGPVGSLPSHRQSFIAGKYPKMNESAEERKARLAQWRASKGKPMKRPPSSVVLQSAIKVQKDEPVIKSEPEEPRQLFWATMAEEDEQEWFTLKVNQIFAECQKLIDEGIAKDEILSLLEKQIVNIPEAKKLSRYWECLARLEQREGKPYKVIELCEEAVVAGAQPLDDLRAILANTLEQLKTEEEETQKKASEEEYQAADEKPEVKSDPDDDSTIKDKIKKGRRRAMKYEPKSPTTPEKADKSPSTPVKEDSTSVIRFNITTTPHLEKIRKLQMMEGESSIKGYKFLTPVRRSSRLERKSHRFPDMLRDHDPCIAGIAQLEDLEDPQTCPNAYIFRKNEALKEINARSLTKK